MAFRKKLKGGFTLVELMIVVAIVGVLAVLAVYGVRKYIANAKTAEAKNSLGQIGKDAAVYDEHELAEHFFSRALTLAEPDAPWRFDLVARRLFVLKRLGQHAEALKLATLEQIHCAESPDVFFALGDVLLDWAVNNPAQAAPLLAKAETAWLRCLAIGERPDIAGAVQGRGGRLAAHNLALVYEFSARPEMAARLRAQFGLDTRQLLG